MYNKKDFLAELKFTYINSEIQKYEKEMESASVLFEIMNDIDEFNETSSKCTAKIEDLKSDPDYQYYNSLDNESRENLKHLNLEYNDYIGPDKLITVAAFLYPDVNDYKRRCNVNFEKGLKDTYLSYDDVTNKYNELYYDPEISLSTTDFVFQKKVELLLESPSISSNGYWSCYTPDFFYKKFLELEKSFKKGAKSLEIKYKDIFPNLSKNFDKLKGTLGAYRISYSQSEFFNQPEKAFELYQEQIKEKIKEQVLEKIKEQNPEQSLEENLEENLEQILEKILEKIKEQNPEQSLEQILEQVLEQEVKIFSYNEFKNPREPMEKIRQSFVTDMNSKNFIQLSKNPIIFDRVSELRFKSHEIDLELRQEKEPKPQEKQPTREEPELSDLGLR